MKDKTHVVSPQGKIKNPQGKIKISNHKPATAAQADLRKARER
ncbi:MAG: hypothetical protein OXI61_18775 [Candidatus Poribacteria bacterium]|nr:hypothetical protein [Candidatus Poribacteria bacterium]MDE0690209.1 hypothetical protein [Candidatus Poribacteria bacterium]